MKEYFVFHFDEDGELHMDRMLKDELEKRLNDKYWGENIRFESPDQIDPSYYTGLLIIKGESIIPKSVKIIEKYEITI